MLFLLLLTPHLSLTFVGFFVLVLERGSNRNCISRKYSLILLKEFKIYILWIFVMTLILERVVGIFADNIFGC